MTRKFSVFAASFVVATGLFGAWMLNTPTVSAAAMKPGIEVSQIVGPVSIEDVFWM
jgi:hypothetical protein